MDPALEAVFTSYVEANPDLKAHIEELQQTRQLLRQCRFPDETSAAQRAGTDACNRVESDLLCSELSLREALAQRTSFSAGLVASVVAALMIGVVVGATVVGTPSASAPAAAETVSVEHGPPPSARSAIPALLPAPGTYQERQPAQHAAATPSLWPRAASDSLHVPPRFLNLMRTSSQ